MMCVSHEPASNFYYGRGHTISEATKHSVHREVPRHTAFDFWIQKASSSLLKMFLQLQLQSQHW